MKGNFRHLTEEALMSQLMMTLPMIRHSRLLTIHPDCYDPRSSHCRTHKMRLSKNPRTVTPNSPNQSNRAGTCSIEILG